MKLKVKDNINLEEIGFIHDDDNLIWYDNNNLYVHGLSKEIYSNVMYNPKSLVRIYELTKADFLEKIEIND